MNLAQAVERFRPAILNEQEADIETLKCMAELVELNYYEWSKLPDNDEANQKWADFLLKMAKQRGWFRLFIKHGFLPKSYIHWPNQNLFKQSKVKESKGDSSSVRTISGGAVEQKRRKH